MKTRYIRTIFACLFTVVLFLSGCTKNKEPEEQITKAIWFSFLDYQETLMGRDEKGYEGMVDQILDNVKSIGVNTIYLHATAFTDAYHESTIYPRVKDYEDLTYDPYEIFIKRAHEQNIQVEAWVNPLRSVLEEETEYWDDGFILKQWVKENNERIRYVGGRYYLNPAYEDVRELIVSNIREILEKYDVDGIHLDDYFYPDGAGRNFDAYLYEEENYNEPISREDFRRKQIHTLVREIHDVVKAKKKRFGISVSGNNQYNYDSIYADVSYWMEEGLIDYLIPQIYWGFENPVRPYMPTTDEWIAIVGEHETELYAGLAAYKAGTADGYAGDAAQEWVDNHDILKRQINYALEQGCKGYAFFRYYSLFDPEASEAVREEIQHLQE